VIEDLHDAVVIETTEGQRFCMQDPRLVSACACRLDRDHLAGRRVHSAEHHAHAASAELRADEIRAETRWWRRPLLQTATKALRQIAHDAPRTVAELVTRAGTHETRNELRREGEIG
jgi:hypothetical protein